MTRQEIRDRALQRQVDVARDRHARLERERIERLEAAERANGRCRPNILELAGARTHATHMQEKAERFYVDAGIALFEALLAEANAGEASQ